MKQIGIDFFCRTNWEFVQRLRQVSNLPDIPLLSMSMVVALAVLWWTLMHSGGPSTNGATNTRIDLG